MVYGRARAWALADQFRKTGNNRRDVRRPPSCPLRDLSHLLARPVASRPHRWIVEGDPESALRRLTACNTVSAHHARRGLLTARHVEFGHASASFRTGLEIQFSRQKNFWPEMQLVLPRPDESAHCRNCNLGT